MKKHLLFLIIFWNILFPAGGVEAQEQFADRYHITYITMNDGLPHNFIDDLYKDSRGFLWVSTAGGGLSRFDGYEFINYNPGTPHLKLKSNFIRNVCEDDFQRLWIVSEGGTDIIDLATLQPVIPSHRENDFSGILCQPATRVIKDTQGCIWLSCVNGLHRIEFDKQGEIKVVSTLAPVLPNGPDIALQDIDEDGKIWLGANGEIAKISVDGQGKLTTASIAECLKFEEGTYISDFLVKGNEVWISTDRGLFRYGKHGNGMKQYRHNPSDIHSLSQNYLTDLAITNDKQLIIATLRGINIYNPITDNFERFACDLPNSNSNLLNSNFINCMLTEGDHIWFGTESGGINLLNPKRLPFHYYPHDKENPLSLSCNPVNAIYEDKYGTLWVGTVEGGLNRKEYNSEDFIHYTCEHGGLTHNSVSALTADQDNRLWVGTWGGGINLFDLDSPKQAIKVISSQTSGGFPIDFIGTLIYDSINKGMWIGSNQGLYFYDIDKAQLIPPFADKAGNMIHGCIGSIIDREGKLWVGCMEGVYIIDLHSRSSSEKFRYKHLHYKLDDPDSRLIEKITCFYETQDGTLWLGSNGYGIYKRTFDSQGEEKFISYDTTQGLVNNSIRGILEDSNGKIWISTNNGLSCYHPAENHFTNYTQHDGLPDTQFYWNAFCRSSYDRIYFGSVGGLIAVESNRLSDSVPMTKVRFTRLRIGNKEILPGNEYLPQDIAITTELKLHEKEKSFSVEFSALNFKRGNADVYSYRLVGFDDRWIQVPGNRRFASYTNLPPGNYTLQVKYTPNGKWTNENVTELKITIIPYFYKDTWFILSVIILILIGIWQFHQWRVRTLKHQKEYLCRTVEERTKELEQQKYLLENQTEELIRQNRMLTQQNEKITKQKTQLVRMSRKIQELTLDKISFFTNITHEFRTPVTLIIGPIERALKLSRNPQVVEQLNLVERNSKYLLSLVNQLMDFRKVESGKLEIIKTQGNLLNLANSIITPFKAFAGERNIKLNHYYRMETPDILYDGEAMRKVITNLLSNAIKFTPNGGTISLYIASLTLINGEKKLYICVKDTGSGIPEEDINRIFNRFYQSRNQMKYPVYGQAGTGIGLYLCKKIIQIHGGEIKVRNNRHTGCSFRILLPLQPGNEKNGKVVSVYHNDTETIVPLSSDTPKKKEALTILVVEDNADMRKYIHSILREQYYVMEASNGEEALCLLNNNPIDFIISDLMMPVMDGIELSRRVKETFPISHIPFLMLTARTSQETRLESYRTGVDEYLLKPFDETLLLTRIQNILENRKRYQRKFTFDMDIETLNMDEESGDKKFLKQVMEVIKENYKNSYFEVGDFSEAVGVSKSLLNKKLQNLIGQPAGQFIRNYRLNIARELILKNKETKSMNIAEVAYEVGFNDPKYFTRCFTKQFNVTPSAMMNHEKI
ncbi:two-component regulator propeller domain-containing protein [uncultured Bacteroides sp.]|uniref:two-component regulator propeller domain-containing protein n=1 Tax=uncultured Bacteroides sp. TaxID=162156 RepID=UPI00267633E9|nr:two-component regulator propeller domain-containing protein [uncultured Bacteroides sp.]